MEYLYELENKIYRPPPTYNKPPYKNYRMVLLNWLVEVTKMFKLYTITLCNCITILDAYWSLNTSLPEKKIQVCGIMCLFLSSYVTEIYPLDISDCTYICDNSYDVEELTQTKNDIINKLNGYLIRPSPYLFINTVGDCKLYKRINNNENNDNDIICSIMILVQSCIELSSYKQSLIAELILYLYSGHKSNNYSYLDRKIGTNGRYTFDEISEPCKIFTNHIKKIVNYEVLVKLYEPVELYIKKQCGIFSKSIDNSLKSPCGIEKVCDLYGKCKKVSECLGEGTFAKAFKIQSYDKRLFIAKEYHNDSEVPNELACLNILRNIDNSTGISSFGGIVNLEEFNIINNEYFLIFELGQYTLNAFVKKGMLSYDKNMIISHFKNILKSVEWCHNHDIIHGDIKPDNIVWFEKEKIFKLIDFGSAIPIASFKKVKTFSITTAIYRAPEIFLENEYDYKIDVWSVGMVYDFMLNRGKTEYSLVYDYYFHIGDKIMNFANDNNIEDNYEYNYENFVYLMSIYDLFSTDKKDFHLLKNDTYYNSMDNIGKKYIDDVEKNLYKKYNIEEREEFLELRWGDFYFILNKFLVIDQRKRNSSKDLLECLSKI